MQAINLCRRLFLPKEDLVEFDTGAIVKQPDQVS